jgi:aspartate dehydrogenase
LFIFKPTTIGLLGCGNIGSIIANNRGVDSRGDLNIVAVYDTDRGRAQRVAEISGAKVCHQFAEFIAEEFSVLVEAASIAAVVDHAEDALRAGKDLVVLSVGAFADIPFRKRVMDLAQERHQRVHIPSGAIAGLDALRAAAVAGIDTLTLRTTKHPRSLGLTTDEKTCVYRGTASASIERFPRNINVAVALSIAANVDAQVEIWADPDVVKNIHEVVAQGSFGRLDIQVANEPSPDNPRTSYLAGLSVLALLRGLDEPVIIGA